MSGAIIKATVVTMDDKGTVLKDAGLLWEGTRLTAVGPSEEIRQKAAALGITTKDAKGAVLFPGLIDTHNHLFQHLLKGLGADMNLESWWPSIIGPTGVALRGHHLRAAVDGGVMEALRTGTTTIVDYMQVHPVSGLSAEEIDEAASLGIRLVYGRGFRDYTKSSTFPRELVDDLDEVFREVEGLKKLEKADDPMLRIYLAPAAAWGCTFDSMKETAAFSESAGVPITMHVFETNTDNEVCTGRYGMRAIDFYEKSGLLSPSFLAVHCVKMDERDIAVFKAHDVKISHNPVSNMYLASGVSPVPTFIKEGLTVSIGCDGAASNNSNNMLEALKFTALLHKVFTGDPQAMTAQKVLYMATRGGAEAIGLSDEIGSLEEGKRADFFMFDPLRSSTCSPMHDPLATLVYSADSRGVVMTVVNGKVLLEDGAFTELDEEKLIKNEQAMALDLVEKTDFSRAAK